MQGYRKDIDGLRAISVLLVIFYHLGFLSAGFIGVDIFFVISGFLITQHIYCDINNGRFSLREFYLKRIRRILPALLCVLVFTTFLAYLLLLPNDLKNYALSMLATLGSFSNFYFYKHIHYGYFATNAKVIPLLHTWSLGVEEQFYVVWPLLLRGLLLKFSKKIALIVSSIICVFSFFLYFLFHLRMPAAVFYFPVTRGFECLIGGILCFISLPWAMRINKYFLDFLSLVGLMAIVYGSCFLNAADYPGFNILFPCFGAALLIYTGKFNALANQLLSWAPLVFIGLISYSLYLWHWPFIAFAHYLNILIGIKIACLILMVSLFFSILSWYFVERIFRFKFKFDFLKTCSFFILIPVLLSVFFFIFLKSFPGAGFNKISPAAYSGVNNLKGVFANDRCIDSGALTPSSEQLCALGEIKQKKAQVLVVGDSHAMASAGMISVLLEHAGLKGYLVTQSGTPFILGDIADWRSNKPMERNRLVEQLILRYHYQYVVMVGFWNYYPMLHETKNVRQKTLPRYSVLALGLRKAVAVILAAHSVPIIFLDAPPLLNISPYCGFTRLSYLERCENDEKNILSLQKTTRNIIFSLQKQYPKLILVDLSAIFCRNLKCYSSIEATPLYHSGGYNSHLNYLGSLLVGKLYLQQYGDLFNSNRMSIPKQKI